MERKIVVAAALLALAAGGVGWVLRGRGDAGDAFTGTASPTGGTAPAPEETSSSPRLQELTRRVAALEAEVRALRVDEAAHWEGLRSELARLRPPPGDTTTGAQDAGRAQQPGGRADDDPAAVARVRDRWSAVLDAMEQRLRTAYPVRPDPRTDLVTWSRFDDLERARAALDGARDLAALRALAEGEFKSTFRWEK